jgi:hypothetical protein
MLRYEDFAGGAISPDVAREVILVQQANRVPLIATLLAAGAVAPTVQPEFKWFTDAHAERRTQINNGGTAYNAGTTALVVDNAAAFYPECLALAEATGEVMFVSAVNTGTNTITVVRGLGSVVAAAAGSVADNAFLRNIGPARGEGADAPSDRTSGPTEVSNHTQLFRETISITGTMQATQTLTADERARQRAKKFEEITESMENAFLFGARATGAQNLATANGERVRTTKGVLQAITTNVWNAAGTVTEATMIENFWEPLYRFGTGAKAVLCGGTVLNTLHAMYKDRVRFEAGQTAVGLNIGRIITPYGEASIIYQPQFKGAYAGWALGVDLSKVRMRNLRALAMRPDIQPNGKDAVVDEWLAEAGIEWGDEQSHAVAKGITGLGS